MRSNYMLATCFLFLIALGIHVGAQTIPTPKEHFGFNIGDDYMLANYTQAEAYYKKVANASDRVLLKEIGKTEEGRDQYIIVISSPQNILQLAKYQSISQKLARAEGLSDEDAKKMSLEGKAVVWIDGGLHATETVGSHEMIELLYQLASRNDAETKRILNDDIILLSQVNPDGQELVANWYMRNQDVKKRSMDIPGLYQKYIGHDNNRDFYMNNMSESKNISRVLYIDWMPQILYNHHQTAPAGAVVAGPPYRDPFNFVYDPLLVTGIDAVGAAMINRLNTENKPGFTRLSGSVYSTWWNGGLRTTAYFHNIIGLLTEITGNPTPSEIPLVPDRLIPNEATPFPVTPQKWHFKNSIDYSISLNYAVLDYASRYKDELLYNIYRMGRNNIEKGNRDNWSFFPRYVDSVKSVIARNQKKTSDKENKNTRDSLNEIYFDSVFKAPQNRDARGYIIAADNQDFFTATKFVNALIESGIRVEKATAAFSVEGKKYSAGSYVIKTDQAFRPHVIDMFDPQDHPNDFQYPGGPPVRPYDAAGWTLAYQMGIQFDRILNKFEGPFQTIPYGEIQSPAKEVVPSPKAGYILSPSQNNSFLAINELLKNGIEVFRLPRQEGSFEAGSIYVPSKGSDILKKAGLQWGVQSKTINTTPVSKIKITPARAALFDQYGGSIPSGWVRWLMEQFHFPFRLIYPQEIDKGNLNAKYDVILFIDTYMPNGTREYKPRQPKADDIPSEYRDRLGSITKEKTIPQLKSFLEKGGNIVTIGNSTSLAYLLDLPVKNALTTKNSEGDIKPLSPNDYYIPGSLLTALVDNNQPENWGMAQKVDMVFNNSNVFSLNPDAIKKDLRPLAWFGNDKPLKSGWAWGQSYIEDGVVAFVAPIGKGRFYACSTEITFRAQPYGTFKMLFNQLYLHK
ncbi:MAG: M14 metallopeptidase family protein [Ginsengibacter sp.]